MRIPPLPSGPVEVGRDFLYLEKDPQREVELPEGAYLRELVDLDLESPEAIVAFVEARGYPAGEPQRLGPMWSDLQVLWGERPEDMPRDLPGLPEDRTQQVQRHRGKVAFSLAEFIERARLIKDLTQIQLYRRGLQNLEAVAASWQSTCLRPPSSPSHALYAFVIVMNWGLSIFQPFLGVAVPEGDEPEPRFEHALTLRRPRLLEALYLQLFNDVVQNVDYARCKNSTCHRWFKVTTHGKLFCDNSTCARLEAQRQFRRRGTKRWTEAAAGFADEMWSADSSLDWEQVYERFAKLRPDQPYHDLAQFQKACEAASVDDDQNGVDYQ